MPGVIEPILGLMWIYNLLDADATLHGLATGGIWTDLAPAGAGFPRITVQQQGAAIDTRSDNGAELIWSTPIYVVKATDKSTDYELISPIAARIHKLLQGTEGTTDDGRIVSCVRDLSLLQPDGQGEIQYRTIMQQYRVEASANDDDD